MDEGSAPRHATVIAPSFGRPDGLVRLLRGLAVQEAPGVSWDLVVVDNNTAAQASERTAQAFADTTDNFPVPARLVHERRTGAANARNRGITETSGDIVVFIDDDVVPRGDWLRTLLEPILAGRSSAAGGRVTLDPAIPRPRWFASWMPPFFAAFEPSDEERDVCDLIDTIGRPFVLTASAAFRTDLVRAAGGFDPRLGPREGVPSMCDDMELCLRYQVIGGTIRFVPASVVVHELPESRLARRYILRRSYWIGRSTWLLDEHLYRQARLGGIRSMITGVSETWRKSRRSRDDQIGLRVVVDVAEKCGLIREGLHHARRGLRHWRTGAAVRASAFDELIPSEHDIV